MNRIRKFSLLTVVFALAARADKIYQENKDKFKS